MASKPKSRRRVSDYDDDDGFVEDAAPKGTKRQKKTVSGEMQKDDDGNEFWEVCSLRSYRLPFIR